MTPAGGSPAALVNVPLDGVPKAPLKVMNAPAEPTFTARAVATPVPSFEIRPKKFASVSEAIFDHAIAAAELMSAFTIESSVMFADVIANVAHSGAVAPAFIRRY